MVNRAITIPTINDSTSDFISMSRLYSEATDMVDGNSGQIHINFHKCKFLRSNAVAFLGGLIRFIENKGANPVINWGSIDQRILMNLCQNGFAEKFGYDAGGWDGNSVPYREDTEPDHNGVQNYLMEEWLGKNWVHVSEQLGNDIAGNVWEIYDNAFEHSDSDIGIYTCGQHFPRKNELHLSITDFGIGIPLKVRNFFAQKDNMDKDNLNMITD